MANKITVISALTFLVTHVGIAPTALAHEAELVEQRCQSILETGNRSALQQELESLLDEHPNHHCIPLIVGLLGGSPLATTDSGFGSGSERSDNDDTIGTSAAADAY